MDSNEVINMADKIYGIKKNKCLVEIFDAIYPVGSIYMSVKNTNPSQLFGGTWTEWGTGRVPVGVASDAEFNTVEKTGGSKTHTLTVGQMPSHNHGYSDYLTPVNSYGFSNLQNSGTAFLTGDTRTFDESRITKSTGSSQAHNNLQPYITCYMWKRTA